MAEYIFVDNTFMVPYTREVADYCDPFSCGDDDLDDFFGVHLACIATKNFIVRSHNE